MISEKEFAVDLAKQAGKIMKRYYFSDDMGTTMKEDTTPLTKADIEINQLVIDSVKEAFPDHDVLAEEGSSMTGSKSVWVCDPIDGTIPYAHGMQLSTFSLAYVEDGLPRLGVVYAPFTDELFLAEKGKGATRNGEPIQVSDTSTLVGEIVAFEMWITCAYPLHGMFDRLVSANVQVTKLCSLAIEGVLVGSGNMVGAIFTGKTAWDIAACKVIVEEAGGKVTDLDGNEQRYDKDIKGAVISNGVLHDKLLDIVKA